MTETVYMNLYNENVMEEKKGKIDWILGIYSKLANGEIVKKAEETVIYDVNGRSIQRDIDDIRNFLVRVDCIKNLKVLDERFHIPYSKRFEEGEFRKRVQFMYGGKQQKVKFQYLGSDIGVVLDQLPSAVVLDECDGVYTVEAEVFGKGIEMWLRSQGEAIRVLSNE